jgi:hypothetical protein
VDGERIALGHFASTKGNADAVGYGVVLSETIAAPVDQSVFEKIAVAKTVEMKIGPYVVKLNAKGIDHFRSFVAALPAKIASIPEKSRIEAPGGMAVAAMFGTGL